MGQITIFQCDVCGDKSAPKDHPNEAVGLVQISAIERTMETKLEQRFAEKSACSSACSSKAIAELAQSIAEKTAAYVDGDTKGPKGMPRQYRIEVVGVPR